MQNSFQSFIKVSLLNKVFYKPETVIRVITTGLAVFYYFAKGINTIYFFSIEFILQNFKIYTITV